MTAVAAGTRVARAATAAVDLAGSAEAGRAAARAALAGFGPGEIDVAVCVHHGRHDGEAVLRAVREELGPGPAILGGTAMGVITNGYLGYEGHQCGVALLGTGAGQTARVVSATGLGTRGERPVGRELMRRLTGNGRAQLDGAVFLYSSIRRGLAHPEGFALNVATPLVAGLTGAMPEDLTLAGAGLIDSHQSQRSHVLTDRGPDPDGAVALGVGGGLQLDTVVLHGCRPAGTYRTITRVDGSVLLEIDGRPALRVLDELISGAMPREEYPLRIILGVNRGAPFAPYDESAYQTRLCLAIDEAREALVMFEPDLEVGSMVQLMRTSDDVGYVEAQVRRLVEGLGERRPVLALYLDCAGRSATGWGMEEEEGDAVRAAIGDIPLLGFYTGVEVAPVGGIVRPLDWTGVLCLLSV